MSSAAYNVKMFFLNIWKKAIKGTFIETYLSHKTQGKNWDNIFIKIAPTLEQYSPSDVRIVKRFGINYALHPYDYDDYALYYGLDLEPRTELFDLVKDGMTVFDIGTNIGHVLLTFANKNITGKNFGFEPVPHIYERAKKNISLNNFNNIVLNNVALSDTSEDLVIQLANTHHSGSSRLGKKNETSNNNNSTIIKAITLDEFVQQNKIEKIDFMKIDVEGFEKNILAGAKQTLKNFKPLLFVEINDKAQKMQNFSGKELIALLESFDYTIYSINGERIDKNKLDYTSHFDIICKHN